MVALADGVDGLSGPGAGRAAAGAITREWLQSTLERLMQEVVDEVGTFTLWEWEYTFQVSLRLADAMRKAGVEDPCRRLMADHCVQMGDRQERAFDEAARENYWRAERHWTRPRLPASLHWLFQGDAAADAQMRNLLEKDLKPEKDRDR